MAELPRDSTDQNSVRIRRGRVGSVDLYEVKDSELDILEKGSPADIQLNFSIFLLSVAISGVFSLATSTFANPRIETTFIVVTVVGFILGIYLMISWMRNRTSLRSLCKSIRERIPPDVAKVAGDDIPPPPSGPKA